MSERRLENVWLVRPPSDADDWEPASVFETWEQAVAALTEPDGGKVEVEEIGPHRVRVTSGDDNAYEVIAVPIEYSEG